METEILSLFWRLNSLDSRNRGALEIRTEWKFLPLCFDGRRNLVSQLSDEILELFVVAAFASINSTTDHLLSRLIYRNSKRFLPRFAVCFVFWPRE